MQQILRSIVLSILASVVASYLLPRIILAAGGTPGGANEGEPGTANVNVTVVVMPIIVGNGPRFGGPRALRKLKHVGRKLRA
jgi:hypothetical protein